MKERSDFISNPDTPILIVDDNTQYSQILTKMLQGVLGYTEVVSVDSTTKAYDLISADPSRFRLLFVDFHFPGGETGGKLLQRLNQATLLQDKIAFVITSEPSIENTKLAVDCGACGVVAKPFDRNELKKQLEKARRSVQAEDVEGF